VEEVDVEIGDGISVLQKVGYRIPSDLVVFHQAAGRIDDILLHATSDQDRAEYPRSAAGVSSLEPVVILEVRAINLHLFDGTVDVMPERRQPECRAGIRCQPEEPLEGVVGVAQVLWDGRGRNDPSDLPFGAFDASRHTRA